MANYYNPYSFVPLAGKVCWISENDARMLKFAHNIPFKDSLSGRICVSFEAETPFCVRDGGEMGYNMKAGSRYFIPATSIKGMIRSIFEMITLSNVANNISDDRYSMRDLVSPDYELKSGEQKSGFLIQLNGNFYIHPCLNEKYSYSDIEDAEGVWIKECKSVAEKYGKIESRIAQYEDGSFAMWFFSGYMKNKQHEYLFDIPEEFNRLIPLQDDEYNDFIFIHEKENENKNWSFWKKCLRNYSSIEDVAKDCYKGIVPCFYRTMEKNGSTVVRDLGFSYLYRQPYKKTIHNFIPAEYHKKGCLDLTQAVFGYVDKNDALRGRVQFCHSFIDDAKLESKRRFVMGAPKPTFFPFYLEQKQGSRLSNYFSKDGRISGVKRYLLRKDAFSENDYRAKDNQATTFVPLSSGTRFSSEITFHNLRDFELGALLAAIDFCGNKNCMHSLGYAKPLGYGRLKLKGVKVEVDGGETCMMNKWYRSFVDYLTAASGISEGEWQEMIAPLLKIAAGDYQGTAIRYPELNEFRKIKNEKKSLKDFSPIK